MLGIKLKSMAERSSKRQGHLQRCLDRKGPTSLGNMTLDTAQRKINKLLRKLAFIFNFAFSTFCWLSDARLSTELQSSQPLFFTDQLSVLSDHTAHYGARPQGTLLSSPHTPRWSFFLQSKPGLGNIPCYEVNRMCSSSDESSSHNVFCAHRCPVQSTQANEHLLGLACYLSVPLPCSPWQ